jgi:hypothetical protein
MQTDPDQLISLARTRLNRLAAKYNELSDAVVNFSCAVAVVEHIGVAEGP